MEAEDDEEAAAAAAAARCLATEEAKMVEMARRGDDGVEAA